MGIPDYAELRDLSETLLEREFAQEIASRRRGFVVHAVFFCIMLCPATATIVPLPFMLLWGLFGLRTHWRAVNSLNELSATKNRIVALAVMRELHAMGYDFPEVEKQKRKRDMDAPPIRLSDDGELLDADTEFQPRRRDSRLD